MGGFLYVARDPGVTAAEVRARYRRSIEALESKGLSETRTLRLKEAIVRERFVVWLYDKIGGATQNVVHFPAGEFIAATGTLIYRGRSGETALRELFADFDPARPSFNDLRGQFCVLINRHGSLYAFSDYFGVYQVFANDAHTVLSSSFLAVARSLDTLQVSTQALYEYVADGACYGDETFVRGVSVLDAHAVHRLAPERARTGKKFETSRLDGPDFAARVEDMAARLVEYWRVLGNCFPGGARIGLSGGYDSRLILALLMEVGMRTDVYVYGSDRSRDVLVSKAIGKGENIPIHHDAKRGSRFDPETFARMTRLEFFYSDGCGPNGVFTNGAEMAARADRTGGVDLQLNGGGGEIFRDFWRLPDRPMNIRDFLRSRYDALASAIFTGAFDEERYFDNLAAKVRRLLHTESESLMRRQVEMLYVLLRVRYWMGHNTSIQNLRTCALIPLVEPVFAVPSWDIPIDEKPLGRFEAALIRRLNPRLAGYDSVYGYDFRGEPPWWARAGNYLVVNAPVAARPALRRLKTLLVGRVGKPFFLRDEYLAAVLPGPSCAAEFVNLQAIRDPLMMSRSRTVDLVLNDPW